MIREICCCRHDHLYDEQRDGQRLGIQCTGPKSPISWMVSLSTSQCKQRGRWGNGATSYSPRGSVKSPSKTKACLLCIPPFGESLKFCWQQFSPPLRELPLGLQFNPPLKRRMYHRVKWPEADEKSFNTFWEAITSQSSHQSFSFEE